LPIEQLSAFRRDIEPAFGIRANGGYEDLNVSAGVSPGRVVDSHTELVHGTGFWDLRGCRKSYALRRRL
jgi:hypothetical protein